MEGEIVGRVGSDGTSRLSYSSFVGFELFDALACFGYAEFLSWQGGMCLAHLSRAVFESSALGCSSALYGQSVLDSTRAEKRRLSRPNVADQPRRMNQDRT